MADLQEKLADLPQLTVVKNELLMSSSVPYQPSGPTIPFTNVAAVMREIDSLSFADIDILTVTREQDNPLPLLLP